MTKAERFAVVTRAFEAGVFDDLVAVFWYDETDTTTKQAALARLIEARVLAMFGFFLWFGWIRTGVQIRSLLVEELTLWQMFLDYEGPIE